MLALNVHAKMLNKKYENQQQQQHGLTLIVIIRGGFTFTLITKVGDERLLSVFPSFMIPFTWAKRGGQVQTVFLKYNDFTC